MPSNWSKIRDEWLNRTAIAKDDAKWALEALINSEEELFEIEQKIKNKEDVISQVKVLKKRVKDTISSKENSLDDINVLYPLLIFLLFIIIGLHSELFHICLTDYLLLPVQFSFDRQSHIYLLLWRVLILCFSFPLFQFLNTEMQHSINLGPLLQPKLSIDK